MSTGTILDYAAHGAAEDEHSLLMQKSEEELIRMLLKLGAKQEDIDKLDKNVTTYAGCVLRMQMAQPVVKEGRRADHELGVVYQGPWETASDGFGEHTRRSVEALSAAGCPIQLRSLSARILQGIDPTIETRMAHLAHASIGRTSATVFQIVPKPGLLARMVAPSRFAAAVVSAPEYEFYLKRRVYYAVWERSPIPPDDVLALNHVGQVWVPCKANVGLLKAAGMSRPTHVIPVPFRPDDPHLAGEKRPQSGLKRPVRFYHIGKWEPRKNQDRIFEAFLRAFKPGEAELYVKTSPYSPNFRGTYPQSPVDAVRAAMAHPDAAANGWRWPDADDLAAVAQALGKQGVKIFQKILSEKEVMQLHMHCDVYVTLSSGEGFDMPAFDAKLTANLMVYVPSGGPQDFAGEFDSIVPAPGTKPCHPFYQWPAGSTYLDWRMEDAVAAMRLAAERVRLGSRARGLSLVDGFSQAAVGKKMLAALEELVEASGGGKVF